MMSKKDYINIGRAIADLYQQAHAHLGTFPEATDSPDFHRAQARVGVWSEVLDALASAFSEDNYRFKRERWFSFVRGECGPNGGIIKK